MDQKILSPFNDFATDILGRLFGFFDRLTLIDITRVNKSWCAVAELQLNEKLLQHYHTQTPDALKEGHLLNTLCDWVASHPHDEGDIFSEEQQKLFFQQFKQAAWGIASDGSETPLQFIRRISAIFQKGYEFEGDNRDQVVRLEYLQKYLKKIPLQISFLFDTKHVKRALNLYDCTTHTLPQIINSQDQKFLAHFLACTQDVESFLTALFFFFDVTHQIPSANGSSWQRWEVLKRSYAKHTLRGDGVVALSTHVPRVMADLLDKWNNPNNAYPPLSSDEVQFFFKKLRPSDFISYLNIIGSGLTEAIRNKQPQLITLLSCGDTESDIALIHFYKKISPKFFEVIEPIPELVSRLKDRLFLKRFLNASFISDEDKSRFAKRFLSHTIFVKDLDESELVLLAQHLVFYVFDDMSKFLAVLSTAKKLTGSFLLALAKVGIPHYLGDYALFIAQDVKARAVLAQKENAEYAFGIIKIAFESAYSQNKRCELLHDTAVIQNFSFEQLRLLYASIQAGEYHLEERHTKKSCLQNRYIEKLANEPNDQAFIDELFIKSSNTFLRDNPNVCERLRRIQNKDSLDYFYQKGVDFCSQKVDSAAEQQPKKKLALSFLVRSEFLPKFDDVQLVWLADPTCYTQNSFFDFLEPLFSANRMTKALFLKLAELPRISALLCYNLRGIARGFANGRYSWLNRDLALAFELINFELRNCDEKVYDFLTDFMEIIRSFSFTERITLLENTLHQENREYFGRFFTFEELRTLWQLTTTKIPYPLREGFFVTRLFPETSAEKFTTEVVHCGITNRTSWNQQYPGFSRRLKKPDVYPFVFGKCVALLATNDLKPLDKNTLNWLELLAFLQKLSPSLNETQKHTILRKYTSQQLYTLCLQLEKTANNPTLEALPNLFYPLCFELLSIAHLQQLKEKMTPKTLKSILWPDPLTQKIEDSLSKKIKTEGASIRHWGDAITTWQRNLALFLFLIGISLLVSGLVLNIVIMWAVAIAPLAIGFGIVAIPLFRTAINSIGKSCNAQTIEQTMTATTTQKMTECTEKTFLLNSDNAPTLTSTPTKREETTSQETLFTQQNPIPFYPMFQPATSSIPAQNNVQEGTPTAQSSSDPSPH